MGKYDAFVSPTLNTASITITFGYKNRLKYDLGKYYFTFANRNVI